jgi:hypothetical protein
MLLACDGLNRADAALDDLRRLRAVERTARQLAERR